MTAWILSTEPGAFPWSRVETEGVSRWDGVRGPLARKGLRAMGAGDRIWGYHSSPEKSLVCLARTQGLPYPDPADTKWLAVDVVFDRWLKRPISLAALKAHPVLSTMDFLRIPRLSVAPVTEVHHRLLLGLAGMGNNR